MTSDNTKNLRSTHALVVLLTKQKETKTAKKNTIVILLNKHRKMFLLHLKCIDIFSLDRRQLTWKQCCKLTKIG